jgi:hypothetical protein
VEFITSGERNTNQGDLFVKERSSNFNDMSYQKVKQETHKSVTKVFVPEVYNEYLEVFKDKSYDSLPPVRHFDLALVLKDPNVLPPFLKIYSLSVKEEEILKDWIEDNLKKGMIRPCKSLAAAPIFFVPKKDGGLRPCIDYRQLNQNTVKDGHPMPLISDIFAKMSNSKIFTKLDLKGAYNLVRIKVGDEWKAAFRCKFGQFEPLVVQFGLTNAPAVFQRFVNSLFPDLLDIHLQAYIDDIIIYSKDLEEHVKIVKEVLKRLISNNLTLKKEKCLFHATSLSFLGHTISTEGIKMEKDKLKALLDCAPPKDVKGVRSFVGLANYYRKFIPEFSKILVPLTQLTKKKQLFIWNDSCQEAFERIKNCIAQDVTLIHPEPKERFFIFSDASDYALGSVLTQKDLEGHFRPIEFLSRKLLPAEINYSVFDKELLAVIESLKTWRHFLIHSPHVVEVFSDHNNLRYFKTTQNLKPRHARWSEFINQFNLVIAHIDGKDNVVADFLSRCPDSSKPALLNEPLIPAVKFNHKSANVVLNELDSLHMNGLKMWLDILIVLTISGAALLTLF